MPKGVYTRTEEHKKINSISKIGLKYPNRKNPPAFSEETRKKMSENLKKQWANGRKVTGMLGLKHASETRKKMSSSHLGKKLSEEHKRKMSEIMRRSGRKPPSRKGCKMPKEAKDKISIFMKGKKHGLGRKQSAEERKNRSISAKKAGAGKWMRGRNAGSKCRWWKGGITPINQAIRTSLEYKLWRKAVFERDNYTCIWCGDLRGRKGGGINADHIKPFAYYPELRFAIDNGRTLCVNCHKTTSTYLKKQEKN